MALPLQNIRVLLVEDDPIIGLDLRQTLEAAGALVFGPAHDIHGAMALLDTSPVEVAVLDNLIVGGGRHNPGALNVNWSAVIDGTQRGGRMYRSVEAHGRPDICT